MNLVQPFSRMTKKNQYKNLNVSRTKIAFYDKIKSIFTIFKGLSLKQIKKTFLEGESFKRNKRHIKLGR